MGLLVISFYSKENIYSIFLALAFPAPSCWNHILWEQLLKSSLGFSGSCDWEAYWSSAFARFSLRGRPAYLDENLKWCSNLSGAMRNASWQFCIWNFLVSTLLFLLSDTQHSRPFITGCSDWPCLQPSTKGKWEQAKRKQRTWRLKSLWQNLAAGMGNFDSPCRWQRGATWWVGQKESSEPQSPFAREEMGRVP